MPNRRKTEWELFPIGGDTGQAFLGRRNQEKVFLKRNSSPFLAALSSEGITPRLMWTKRDGNGDTLTAQEWVNSRTLEHSEMCQDKVYDLLIKIHHSDNLLAMLEKVGGKRYSRQDFLAELDGLKLLNKEDQKYAEDTIKVLEATSQDGLEREARVCHGDVHHQNFLLRDDGNMYLVDWDATKIADPMLDISQLLVQYLNPENWPQWFEQFDLVMDDQAKESLRWYSQYSALVVLKKHLEQNRLDKYQKDIKHFKKHFKG